MHAPGLFAGKSAFRLQTNSGGGDGSSSDSSASAPAGSSGALAAYFFKSFLSCIESAAGSFLSGLGDFFGDLLSGSPVVLDLSGNGIEITQLSSSNNFYTVGSDGYRHRTAWTGAGNAVLFYDPNSTNTITQANQVNFTQWDPGAATDMQALLDVFDTNHDGQLDSGDTGFSSFKLMVTNADGTASVETLAQAGVASINLTADQTEQALPPAWMIGTIREAARMHSRRGRVS